MTSDMTKGPCSVILSPSRARDVATDPGSYLRTTGRRPHPLATGQGSWASPTGSRPKGTPTSDTIKGLCLAILSPLRDRDVATDRGARLRTLSLHWGYRL